MNNPAPDKLPRTEESLPIALIRAREAVMGPIRGMLTAAGLTEQQWRVLRVLEEGGPMDARAVAEGAAVSAPSLSRILVGLEERGMISRQADTKDRRRQVVQIAGAGRAVIAENLDEAKAHAAANRARLGEAKYATLLALLSEISAWKDNS